MEGRERGEKGEKDGRTMGGRDHGAQGRCTHKLDHQTALLLLLQYCIVIDLVFKLMIVELDKMTAV